MISRSAFALIVFAACGCASAQSCPSGLKPMTEVELIFGRDIAGGASVSDADWQDFLDREITPRFPDGLTVEDASGQWKGANGIVREKSKRLTIIVSDGAAEEAKLAAIREAYKARFRQDAVLQTESQACVSF